MIHIERNRTDKNGNDIKPSAEWFRKAAQATNIAIEEGENHKAKPDIYGSNDVRAALEKLFYDKCAYCESKISGTHDWNVEHFRPKGRIAERPDHPGYYWLTYDWYNLYPACEHCNQRRKDKPRWGDLRYASTGGKMDQFPVEDENSRALSHEDDGKKEKKLFIDPCDDGPEKYLCYDITGQILPIEDNNKGKSTIHICHLRRRRLRDRRLKIINAVIMLIRFSKKYNDNRNALKDLDNIIHTQLLFDNCEFAGAARYVNNNKEEFPII